MKVTELALRQPVTIDMDADLSAAAETMAAQGVGALILLDHDRPVGIVTDRDLGDATIDFAAIESLEGSESSDAFIVTAAATLRRLGKGYRFDTVIRGRIQGAGMTTPVYLWGQGDPSLTRDDLTRFAKQLHAKGVRKIPAGVVVDDSYFDAERHGRGWANQQDAGYPQPRRIKWKPVWSVQ